MCAGGSGDPFAALAGMIGASGTKAPRPFTALTASDAPKTLAFTQDHRQKTAPAVKKAERPRLSIVMTPIANEPPSFDVAKTPLPVVGEGVGIDIEADRVGARLWSGTGIPPVVHHSFAEHHRHHPKCGPLTPANALKLNLQQAQTQGKSDTNKRKQQREERGIDTICLWVFCVTGAVGVIMSGQPLSPPLLNAKDVAKAHAASATMPRRLPDLRLPATISAQSRHHNGHRQQQQRYIQPPVPQPPPAMAFAPPPPYGTIGQPLFYALRHTHLTS